jgi:hypothetical protein
VSIPRENDVAPARAVVPALEREHAEQCTPADLGVPQQGSAVPRRAHVVVRAQREEVSCAHPAGDRHREHQQVRRVDRLPRDDSGRAWRVVEVLRAAVIGSPEQALGRLGESFSLLRRHLGREAGQEADRRCARRQRRK